MGIPPHVRRALVASAVGTSIEWYDFFLYGTAAALVFPDLFFPEASHTAGIIASFGTYAVGFAARPVGAALFGHYGDRIGRKNTLIVTLLLMGLASAAIGLTPTHAAIGLWGAAILTFLRVCQGIGVGGEWGGSVLLAMEWGDLRRRGFFASWAQIGVPVGLLLANGAVLGVERSVSDQAWESWGWRLPFLFSLGLVAFGLWIRLAVFETPEFTRASRTGQLSKHPVLEVIRRNFREILLAALIRLAEQAPFYVFTAFALEYGHEELGFSKSFLLGAVMTAATIELFTTPFFGWLSDRIGRRRVYATGVILTAVWALPYFALLSTGIPAVVFLAIAFSLIPHDLQYGPQAALIAETFPTRVRYSGAGLGYQLSSVVAGGPAPLIAAALLAAYGAGSVGVYLVACALVSGVALMLLPTPGDHSES